MRAAESRRPTQYGICGPNAEQLDSPARVQGARVFHGKGADQGQFDKCTYLTRKQAKESNEIIEVETDPSPKSFTGPVFFSMATNQE
ncbi:hypothetical protein SAY87_003184 [Trapa incisa]|uniref:Uncharacterized protein n=1 Tax=Trapa incisa TaxID=236973 RepID=A0AAN7KFB3_9MYRT|nr:hypothetical protein SAY87_003184 [Trapa incisa]